MTDAPPRCEWCQTATLPLEKVTGWMELPGLGRRIEIFWLCPACAAVRHRWLIGAGERLEIPHRFTVG